ncbi:MAG: 2'-5' RNA ligase family protein [Anaerolineaceae bacterium]|nr:2'-5' RNA ligase family protein [Anaerolineaceae bacterium]
MYAIASLLDPYSRQKIQELWNYLESDCGLSGIKETPLPHFSWQGANDYKFPEVSNVLQKLASEIPPFVVRTAGLGIFTSEKPILYLSLVKTFPMIKAHQKIWDAVKSKADQLIEYYAPELWMPHITLAYHDLNRKNLPCAFSELAFQPFDIEISVNNLAVIYQIEQEVGVRDQYFFRQDNK